MQKTIPEVISVTGRKKVLIIAYPEYASPIYEGLEAYIVPSLGPDFYSAILSSGVNTRTVSWLCREVFPSAPSETKRTSLNKILNSLRSKWQRLLGTKRNRAPSSESAMSLFRWGDYDFVIIQDLWLDPTDEGDTVQCAGYVLANLDYYLWGNFSTKKVILVTDRAYASRKLYPPKPTTSETDAGLTILETFDQKHAFELVYLNDEKEKPIEHIIELLTNEGSTTPGLVDRDLQERPRTAHDEIARLGDALRQPIISEAVKALRNYVNEHAELIVVDDEFDELNRTIKEVVGSPLDSQHRQTGKVNVVSSSEMVVHAAASFDELVSVCTHEFGRTASGTKRYTLFVTDILFRGPAWHKTGLDLIEWLRHYITTAEKPRRIGIVAFTAFTTPFIAMSSYQRGVDFVVSKKATRGDHDPGISGTHRLLMTLAFLCFQKSFLHEKRREAGELIKSIESGDLQEHVGPMADSLRQLRSIIPRHAISLHLQQEWLDTCYLFEAVDVYGPKSEQLKVIYEEMNYKYD